MTETGWEKRVNGLRQQLTSIKSRARKDSVSFQELWRQAEYTKVQILAHQLEARRKHLARSRGVASLAENKKGLTFALGMTAGVSILTGMITKDWLAAGVAGANGALRGLGETEWVVCLEKKLVVAPRDNVRQGKDWVTWNSLMIAMRGLEELAKNGAHLGNLDNIISELKNSKKLVFVIKEPKGGATA